MDAVISKVMVTVIGTCRAKYGVRFSVDCSLWWQDRAVSNVCSKNHNVPLVTISDDCFIVCMIKGFQYAAFTGSEEQCKCRNGGLVD